MSVIFNPELGSTSVLNKKMEVRLANLKEILQGKKRKKAAKKQKKKKKGVR